MHVRIRHGALLALPTAINAVSLADMTPRATGLPQACNAVYTSQIYGCTATDFQTGQCTQSCINALNGISMAIQHTCGGQGITGENLVVAFLAGVGTEQLCHNVGSDGQSTTAQGTTAHSTTKVKPTIVSSTTTAHKATDTTGSLIVDTSSTMTQTIVPHKTQKTHKTQQTSQTSSKKSSSTKLVMASSTTQKAAEQSQHTAQTTSKTTSAAGNSQTNLNDGSGGGSPFDTEGNLMNSASSISLSLASSVLSAAAAVLALLR